MKKFKIEKVHISKKEWRKNPEQSWYFGILQKTWYGWRYVDTRDIDKRNYGYLNTKRYLCSTEAKAEEVVKNLQYEKII